MAVRFEHALCDQNPWCPAAKVCPSGALYIDRKSYRPTFDEDKCTGCEVCVTRCPRGAMAARD